jgi:hypothetical protein
MIRFVNAIAGVALFAMAVFPTIAQAQAEAYHLRLLDRLDRPQDGYCFDILGTPGKLRLDLPLFAHNCKPRLTVDSAVVLDAQGRILFTEPNVCVTVAGVNGRALPGTSIILRSCDERSSFFQSQPLQRFDLHDDGRLELQGTGLCVSVGDRSDTTYSTADRWRPLFVADCRTASPDLSRWTLVKP